MASNLIQMWSAEVQKQLFETEDFTRYSQNFASMEASSKFTIPSSGSILASTDDLSRPLTPGQRTDTAVELEMLPLIVNPFFVNLEDAWELSFDKRASITEGMANSLNDLGKQKVYWGWMNTSKFANSIKTTGLTGSTLATGATGTRKKITYDDILNATLKLDLQNVPHDGRVMVVPPALYKEIKALSQFVASDVLSTELLSRGVVGMIDGISVVRANVNQVLVDAVASGSTSVSADFGVTGTTYSFFIPVYHPSMVARVIGRSQVWVDTASAIYTSDVISATQAIAGGLTRYDKSGYVAIIQEIG